jgi:hypothetical protein
MDASPAGARDDGDRCRRLSLRAGGRVLFIDDGYRTPGEMVA